jgi:peptide/nickel transport system ATP-binding protein
MTADRVGSQAAGAGEQLLVVDGLSVSYATRRATVPAVRDVSFSVARGEIVALVGESGSGKSTVAHALINLLPRSAQTSSRSIVFDGTSLVGLRNRQWRSIRGAAIGLVPQDPMVSLDPVKRVGDQISEALIVHGSTTRAAARSRAVELLELVGIPEPRARAAQYPSQLSGGMRQRVLIAIALAGSPRLIIADEPTSALDVTVQKHILDYIDELVAETRTALLLITHDLGVAADRAHRIVVMQGGRIVEDGAGAQVLDAPAHPYTRQLMAAAPGLARGGPPEPRPASDVAAAEAVLSVSRLSKTYALPRSAGGSRRLRAVHDVTFAVGRGETLAIVGESGSGKSTTARLIVRLEQPDAGAITFRGEDITQLRGERLRQLRRRLQLVYQSPFASLDPRHTVGDIVEEPLRNYDTGDRAARARRVRDLIDQVSLPAGFAARRPSELSGGQRQRVAIARALALEPELIVLDEPVSALDVSVQAQILALLSDIQQQTKVSYLLISHDLAVVRQLARSLVVMRAGEVVEAGPTERILADPAQPYTRELLEAIPGQRAATRSAANSR